MGPRDTCPRRNAIPCCGRTACTMLLSRTRWAQCAWALLATFRRPVGHGKQTLLSHRRGAYNSAFLLSSSKRSSHLSSSLMGIDRRAKAYQGVLVHPTKAEDWVSLYLAALIPGRQPRYHLRPGGILGAPGRPHQRFHQGQDRLGAHPRRTGPLTLGHTKKQPCDPPKCRPGACTGNGCLVLVDPRLADLDSIGKVCEGGIVSDCLYCILMGEVCSLRQSQPPVALASQTNKGKGVSRKRRTCD
jgi:hypothetical protein